MKRFRVRLRLIKALQFALAAILFATVWAFAGGKHAWNGYVLFGGVLGLLVVGVWIAEEFNLAIEAANVRIDSEVIRGDGFDRRLEILECQDRKEG